MTPEQTKKQQARQKVEEWTGIGLWISSIGDEIHKDRNSHFTLIAGDALWFLSLCYDGKNYSWSGSLPEVVECAAHAMFATPRGVVRGAGADRGAATPENTP